MVDPLAEFVTLLQPGAPFSKMVSAAGSWRVRRAEAGRPFYALILDGSCRLDVTGHAPITLEKDDFVLIPAAYDFTMTSREPPAPDVADTVPVPLSDGVFRVGDPGEEADLRVLVGYCVFASPDAALLVSLLPRLVFVRGEKRLSNLVQMVGEETRERRPAREVVLARLLEVLLIEALRSAAGTAASPGLVRGLADIRLAIALRRMHEDPARPWTVAELANEAALSRSMFFERFTRTVGITPMAYLFAWRMALAKDLLRQNGLAVSEVAERVGYGSASAFSVAFTRHVGLAPMRYGRERPEGEVLATAAPRAAPASAPAG